MPTPIIRIEGPLMRGVSGFVTHFVCGMKRNGCWDFYWARQIACAEDTNA